MMDRPLLEFENVSKRFILRRGRPSSLRELFLNAFRRTDSTEELWALDGVSFAVRPGETLGIIGANGAGKSTILKLASRILEPTSGRIGIEGRVSGLLELGTGFHPDLTGRENVYLYGSILGLSRRQIEARYERIVDFAELAPFMDVPIKNYSSGMQVRLGFAVAINVEPDILLIDEVLAVGDVAFQQKCIQEIYRFRRRDNAIVFVSHDIIAVKSLASRLLWIDKGRIRAAGDPREVASLYLQHMREQEASSAAPPLVGYQTYGVGKRYGSGEVKLYDVQGLDEEGRERYVFRTGESLRVRMRYEARQVVRDPNFGVAIHHEDGTYVNGTNTFVRNFHLPLVEGKGELELRYKSLPLLPGKYLLSVAVCPDRDCKLPYDFHFKAYELEFTGQRGDDGVLNLDCEWKLL